MADMLASPAKKPAFEPAASPPVDPTDIRGSMQRGAQTGYEHMISWRARESRAAVSRGHATLNAPGPSFGSRRPLGFSRTEPNLSFGSSAPPPSTRTPLEFPPFQTARDINEHVFLGGKGQNELRPMWETGSNASDSRTSSRVGSGLFGSGSANGGETGSTAGTMEDGDGDGFDLDEAFGAPSSNLGFGKFSAGLKRGHDGTGSREDGTRLDEHDDDDMVPTDVEDEGEDSVASELPAMFGGAGRRIAGSKRAFGRTQSLPSQAFSSQMEF